MDKIYDKCCGIDVHKKLIVACFRKGNRQELREFGATTRELLEMADWLKEGGCEMIAMESTASYWKPLYNILESSDLKAMVVNASHMKAVPGRQNLRCQVLVNQVMKFWQQELSNRSYINLIKKSSSRTFAKCSERGFFMSSLFMLLIRYKLRSLHLQIRLCLRHSFCQCWLSYHHRPHT